jgi:lactate dehydrogenase-like 2-hydroxyacid dehydrogenase
MTDPVLMICGASFNQEERERLEAALPSVHVDRPEDAAALPEATRQSIRAIAFKGHTPLKAASMDLLPALGMIGNYGVGYDAIDVAAATARGVRVTNTPDVLNDDVADLAIALMLMQARRLTLGSDWVRSGRWPKQGEMPLNRKVSGGTAGIVGLGRIGREIANRLAAFKMDIHYHSRSEKQTPGWTYHADVVGLAKAVDFLFVALVGGPDTANYVSADAIRALGPRGVLINISRGSTVDEAALLDALESGAIAGAGLDVFLNEPDIDPRFLTLENVALQPHQGSGTVETRRAMAQLQLDNIQAFLAGRALLTPVN